MATRRIVLLRFAAWLQRRARNPVWWRDGKLVIMHDGSVDRCTNGKGDVGQGISAQDLVDAVRRHGMEEHVVL